MWHFRMFMLVLTFISESTTLPVTVSNGCHIVEYALEKVCVW